MTLATHKDPHWTLHSSLTSSGRPRAERWQITVALLQWPPLCSSFLVVEMSRDSCCSRFRLEDDVACKILGTSNLDTLPCQVSSFRRFRPEHGKPIQCSPNIEAKHRARESGINKTKAKILGITEQATERAGTEQSRVNDVSLSMSLHPSDNAASKLPRHKFRISKKNAHVTPLSHLEIDCSTSTFLRFLFRILHFTRMSRSLL